MSWVGRDCWCACGFVLFPVMVTPRAQLPLLCISTPVTGTSHSVRLPLRNSLFISQEWNYSSLSGDTHCCSILCGPLLAPGNELWEGWGRWPGSVTFFFCLVVASAKTQLSHFCILVSAQVDCWVQPYYILITQVGLTAPGYRECICSNLIPPLSLSLFPG